METNSSNPWKGLDSYSILDNSIFYGRSKETSKLIETIINNRFTILYGPSGVGKSSLLNAGIRPKLAEGQYFVIDVSMRLLDLKQERSVASQIIARVEECAKVEKVDITPLVKDNNKNLFSESLWYYFHTNEFWSPKNELLVPVVIIDQFEDIFKDEEVREDATKSFFSSLDELSNVVPPLSLREKIEDPESFRYNQSADFRFVCSLREDYLPRLDDYVYSLNIPELRKSRYGITLMDSEQAHEVILGPAGEIVSENVADKIIDILSNQNSQKRFSPNKIEPFLLSLFMYRVYNEMEKRGLSIISEELINNIGGDVVNEFYIESMKKISSKAMKHLENVLLTPKGHRDSISYDKLMESEKVTEEELNTLISARIIKKNKVNNVDRFEFTHDVLSKYAQKNKEKREKNNKSQLLIGYMGTMLTIVISAIIGWIMSTFLSFVSIPLMIIISVICAYGIFNIKLSSKRNTLMFLGICGVLGVFLDLIQIVPAIGYYLYSATLLGALYIVKRFADKTMVKATLLSKYFSIAFVWGLSFVVIPVLCYGYNIFKGMNYSKGPRFNQELFYTKDIHGQYGLRNRDSIIIIPQYGDTLQSVRNEYVAMFNGKYGLLDSSFTIKMPIEFDNYIIYDDKPYFYLEDKEVSESGLRIQWGRSVSKEQKQIIRNIIKNMIKVEGGSFKMGTNVAKAKAKYSDFKPINGEEYLHEVKLSDFYLNKYEVTVEDWISIMGYDPRSFGLNLKGDSINDHKIPVYKVSYEQCQDFVNKISDMTGLKFSLPTEAQWEYAARGGKKHEDFLYAGSDFDFQVGWVDRNSDDMPHRVGEKGKEGENSLGFSDMTGNVAEFCKDCMSTTFYKESKGKKDPLCEIGELTKSSKWVVNRGGSYERTQPENYIVTRRLRSRADLLYKSTGFRLAVNQEK